MVVFPYFSLVLWRQALNKKLRYLSGSRVGKYFLKSPGCIILGFEGHVVFVTNTDYAIAA